MAKKPPIRVALDLETTGLHAEQDAILEVAAIKFQGTTVLDKMETLVAPGRSIPFRVQRLTGTVTTLIDALPATVLLVPADGVPAALYAVPAGAEGVTRLELVEADDVDPAAGDLPERGASHRT